MSPTYQVNVEFGEVVLDHVLSKRITYVSLVFSPAFGVWVRVRPKDIAEHTFLGYLDGSLDVGKFVKILEVRRKSSMHAEDLFIYESSDRHHIEHVNEVLPNF